MNEQESIKQGLTKIIDLVISFIVAVAAYLYGGWESVGKAFTSLLIATTLFYIGYFIYGYHKGVKEELGIIKNPEHKNPFCFKCQSYHPKDQQCLIPR